MMRAGEQENARGLIAGPVGGIPSGDGGAGGLEVGGNQTQRGFPGIAQAGTERY
jgi:hypothetical protein